MEPTSSNCSFHPSILFLWFTLILTSAATAMLCMAIMTEHWEYITWDKEKLTNIEKNLTSGPDANDYKLEWLLDGQAQMLSLNEQYKKVIYEVARVILESNHIQEKNADISKEAKENNLPALFFAPIYGGVWTHCINLSGEQNQLLECMGFPKALCTNYLKLGTITNGHKKIDRQHRMQNLSISCALVCLIILSSSALIGTIGVTKHQISAVLITGVMYFLAAIFAAFSLTIITFKRSRSKWECLNASTSYGYAVEGVIISTTAIKKAYSLNKVNKYFEARIFTTGYSLHLGWAGVTMCILVSILWNLLSKIIRLNPVNVQ